MPTQVFYQVRIQKDTEIGQYNDALYYSPDEWLTIQQADIDAAVKGRVDNWVAFVKEASSKPPVKPTVEDLQLQADQLKEQWGRMVASLVEVGEKKDFDAVKAKLAEAVAATDAAVEAKPIDANPIAEG